MTRFCLVVGICCLTLAAGCVGYRRDDGRRIDGWADWNSYGRFGYQVERRKQATYLRRQIEHFRRTHGKPPLPITLPETIILPAEPTGPKMAPNVPSAEF